MRQALSDATPEVDRKRLEDRFPALEKDIRDRVVEVGYAHAVAAPLYMAVAGHHQSATRAYPGGGDAAAAGGASHFLAAAEGHQPTQPWATLLLGRMRPRQR